MSDNSPAAPRAAVRIRPLRKSNYWKPVSAAEAVRLTPLDETVDDNDARVPIALGDLRTRWLLSRAAARAARRRRLLIAAAVVAAVVWWAYLAAVVLG